MSGSTPKGAVFVLGMHRSGTSALTRGLEVLGIDLGRNLKEPVGGDNEKGFFEDWALSTINDELLALRDGQWDSLFTNTVGDEHTDQVNALKLRAIAAITQEFGRARYFGFKDPRTCRTLPFWKDVLAKSGLNAFYVIAFRNPMSVAKSLQQRDGFTRQRSYYLWLLHMISAVRDTESEARLFVDFDAFMEAPGETLDRLARLIGDPEVALSSEALRRYRHDFLDPGLRHHVDRPAHLDLDNHCPSDVKAVYRLLRGEAGAESIDRAELDAGWRQRFDEFAALTPHAQFLDAIDRGARAAVADLQVRDQRVFDLEAGAAALLNRADAAQARIQALDDDNDRLKEQVRATEEALTANTTAMFELKSELAQERDSASRQAQALRAARAESAAREADLQKAIEANSKHAAELRAVHIDRAQYVAIEKALEQAREAIAEAHDAQTQRHQESLSANEALAAENATLAGGLRAMRASTSWRLTAPLRWIRTSLGTGASRVEAVAAAEQPAATPAVFRRESSGLGAPPTMVFFTICSRNFLAYARTLFDSLREHHPESRFFVALCDLPEAPFDPSVEPFPFIYLDDLDLPEWREMSERYNITEFNTAIKPFVIRHLMRKSAAECVVYLDPDIIVKSRMTELELAFASGASAVLTPHITGPAENVESSDASMLRYGIYNLGFCAFRTSPETNEAVAWWGRRLIKDCVIKLDQGLFVDQKWADLFPAFLSGLHVLRHPGYNVAYWNVAQRKVTRVDGRYLVNSVPLRFAHFSGSKLEDPTVYSRHSGQFNPGNIGDLNQLLDEYRARVFANGHAHYQKMPYAFNWNGASGVNEHTPKPAHQIESVSSLPETRRAENGGLQSAARAYRIVRTATNLAGGLPQLAAKATRAFYTGGFSAIRERVRVVRATSDFAAEVALESGGVFAPSPPLDDPFIDVLPWRKRVLFIDWSTPRPDRDAGSVTAFHLMEVLTNLGYDVTFVPSDLEYLGAYTESLRAMGVRCLHREDIGSVGDHLKEGGADYDIVFMSRAPIAELYISDIRRHAPNSQIILNTSDLHFLRDMRQAELGGDALQIEAAAAAKAWELDILRRCDVSIVLSAYEHELLKAELPHSDVRLMPLIYASLSNETSAFAKREGLIFIGGFPHLPNVDAVLYFAKEIFPLVRARLPNVVWHIVGNAPPPSVMALSDVPGIRVHGHVKDIEPLFTAVRLSVVPLRYGAGIKGKLGTSMAFGVPSVATPVAVEGMEVADGRDIVVADQPEAFANAIVDIYQSEEKWEQLSAAGRSTVLRLYSGPAMQARIGALLHELTPGYPRIEAYQVNSHASYLHLTEFLEQELRERRELERSLIPPSESSFLLPGFCGVCGRESQFNTSFMYSSEDAETGDHIPNWREHLSCVGCGLQNRLRASLHLFYAMLRPTERAKVYLTEQATSLYELLRARHPDLVGSEYLGEQCPLGETIDGIRNEDLTRLTFANDTFDFALSFDVMEHVADDVAAMREVFRTLKPGGRFFFTAPFARDKAKKVVRATLLPNGEIEHILAPEYHGNPIDPEHGALCFRYLAWDALDDLRGAGFENCRVIQYWSRDLAYLGGEQFMIIADKPRKPPGMH